MSTASPMPSPESTPIHEAERTDETSLGPGRWDALVGSILALTNVIRELVNRSPVSPDELLTAEQLGELFHLSPRTLRDLAATGSVPHHRIGKHYRFSRSDIAEIQEATKQALRNRRSYRHVA